MAESAFRVFRVAKQRMMTDIDLSTVVLRAHLYLSGSNLSAALGTSLQHSTKASLTNEVTANQGGYTQSGYTVSTNLVTTSGSTLKFDIADWVITATGGNISNVRYVLLEHSDVPFFTFEISTAAVEITTGNTLTVTMPASGLFELTGGET